MSLLTPLEIGLVQGLVMLGAVLCFAVAFRLLGFPDLTVEGSLPLGGAVYATLVQHGATLPLALGAACAAGGLAGAATAALHIRFGVNKFLSAIIIVAILYSITLRIMAGPNVGLLQASSLMDGPRNAFGGNNPRAGVLAALSGVWTLILFSLVRFLKSEPGIRLRAAGSNPRFAESVGIRQGVAIILGVAACNVMAALAGVIQADLQGFADVSAGQGVLILALAALAIGESLIPKARLDYYKFVILAAAFGSLIYQVLVAYAVRAGLAATDLRLATGALVLLVVAVRYSKDAQTLDAMGVAR